MLKKLTIAFALMLLASTGYAQDVETKDGGIYIEPKLNVAAVCVGIVNPALEIGFLKRSAVELSSVTSFAKKDFLGTGYPLLINMIMMEYRNYPFSERHSGFFVGANAGRNEYKMNKAIIPFMQHVASSRDYDWGVGVCVGITLGYKFTITDALHLELSASGGWQHSWHEPYSNGALTWPLNASGEWLPYKAGLYLSYRLGKWYRE